MPFKSKSQMRACFAKDDPDWDCHQWAHETKNRKKLPERLPEKKHMKFKEFYAQEASKDISEGKVGRAIGSALGFGLPALGGAYASSLGFGHDMFGAGGAPGGLGGAVLGATYGKNVGGAVGDDLEEKMKSGVKGFWNWIRGRKKPNVTDKLKGTDMDPDRVQVVEPKKNFSSASERKDKESEITDYLGQREKLAAASKTFEFALAQAGYHPSEIKEFAMNLGSSNRALSTWMMHFHKMVEDELKAGRIGTAKHIAKRGIQELQDKEILDHPGVYHAAPDEPEEHAPEEPHKEPESHHEPEADFHFEPEPEHHPEPERHPEPEVPDSLEQPGLARQMDLFGNEVEPANNKKRRNRGGGRKNKKTAQGQGSLFDGL